MDLMGQAVTHKAFGDGVITGQDDRHVTAEFADGVTKQFAYPTVFGQFMTLADVELQAAVEKLAAAAAPLRPTTQQEVLRKVEERARTTARPASVATAAPKPAAKAVGTRPGGKAAGMSAKPAKRTFRTTTRASQVVTGSVAVTRPAGRAAAYLAYQGPLLESQADGGYLWAPLATADGQRVPSWDRLEELRPGDVVLHEEAGMVRAVSRVMALWYKTSDLTAARHYGRPGCMGRHVDCTYVRLENPVPVAGLRDEVVGDDATEDGFLYRLDEELAQTLLDEAAGTNPELGRQAFVRRFLSSGE